MNFFENIAAQLPFGKKSDPAEYFFVLNIGLSEVTAAVWAIYGQEIEILSQATLTYEGTDDLLEKGYQVLDKSLGALEIEPQKVLFGVPETWSLDDDLKEPYLKLLRKMLKKFGLQPLAYVTTTNALSFFLQRQEGAPQTAILIGIGDFLEVTLTKGGKMLESRAAKRSGSLFEDIEKILSQFTEVEVLPSKILLYPTNKEEDLAKVKDDLMSFPWMQRLSFLHFPKIDLLNEDIALSSVVLSAACEMNPHINFKHHFVLSASPSPLPSRSHSLKPPEEELGFVEGDIKEHLGKIKGDESKSQKPLESEEMSDQKAGFTSQLVSPDLPESAYESGPEEEELLADSEDFEYSRPLTGRSHHSAPDSSKSFGTQSSFSLPAALGKATSLMTALKPKEGVSAISGRLLTTKLLIPPVVLLLLAGGSFFGYRAISLRLNENKAKNMTSQAEEKLNQGKISVTDFIDMYINPQCWTDDNFTINADGIIEKNGITYSGGF